MALELIDKEDNSEIVRDKIAQILFSELANQQSLAPDPVDYMMSIYVERNLPVEKWLNSGPVHDAATVPIVSVWVESSNFDSSTSAPAQGEQHFEVTYILDVMARGVNSDDPGGGHIPADRDARLRCQAAVRLVRNILSAGPYRYLGLKGTVWAYPKFENIEYGSATLDETENGISIWNGRCRFKVKMTETSPLEAGENNIELIHVDISDDGEVILSAVIS